MCVCARLRVCACVSLALQLFWWGQGRRFWGERENLRPCAGGGNTVRTAGGLKSSHMHTQTHTQAHTGSGNSPLCPARWGITNSSAAVWLQESLIKPKVICYLNLTEKTHGCHLITAHILLDVPVTKGSVCYSVAHWGYITSPWAYCMPLIKPDSFTILRLVRPISLAPLIQMAIWC